MKRFICFPFACLLILLLNCGCRTPYPPISKVSFDFRPKPTGLTNPPTIGEPVIDVPNDLVDRLGGSDVTNMAATAVGDLLVKSERFTLIESDNPVCECKVRLTGLSTQQIKKGFGLGSLLPILTNLFPSLTPPNILLTNLDLASGEMEMRVNCGVSMRIVHANSIAREVLAVGEGEVAWTNTTKNITTTLMGAGSTNAVAFDGRLIQLASYYALTDMLTNLDERLLQLPPTPPTGTNAFIESAKPVQ